ncbi:hypothetical protein FQR65_LT06539 [Abscondita terminalis]|nr:hypothetical protein FQR65_LT06539 [Abscondita terminalis]
MDKQSSIESEKTDEFDGLGGWEGWKHSKRLHRYSIFQQERLSQNRREFDKDNKIRAGKQGSRMARENENIDEVPFITVYLDGTWSKRSYGSTMLHQELQLSLERPLESCFFWA